MCTRRPDPDNYRDYLQHISFYAKWHDAVHSFTFDTTEAINVKPTSGTQLSAEVAESLSSFI